MAFSYSFRHKCARARPSYGFAAADAPAAARLYLQARRHGARTAVSSCTTSQRGPKKPAARTPPHPTSPAEAETAILASLLVDGTLDPADKPAAAEALQVFDPLSCFELDVSCPTCAVQADIPVDLEAVLLSALARAQTRLIVQVDRLARRYGWSEAEILAVPDWRRRRYLALEDQGWPA